MQLETLCCNHQAVNRLQFSENDKEVAMNCSEYQDHVRRIDTSRESSRERINSPLICVAETIALCGVLLACLWIAPPKSDSMEIRVPSVEYRDSGIHLRDESPFLWLGFD
jgi:Zn-finger domain-containing protein